MIPHNSGDGKSESSESPELCGITHDVIDLGLKKGEMCGVAEIDGRDISNNETCLMAHEVTNNSQFLYYESDDGIEDLELVKSELDRYEKEFLESQTKN